jgi:spore maturation protein CgeB
MKIMQINSYYQNYLNYFQKHHLESFENYADLYSILMADFFGIADFWREPLIKLGLKFCHSISGFEALDRLWMKERNLSGLSKSDLLELQIAEERPDALLIYNPFDWEDGYIAKLKAKFPFIHCAVGFLCAPSNSLEKLKEFDGLLTCTPGFVELFHPLGRPVKLLYHAFAAHELADLPTKDWTNRKTDVLFSGSLVSGHGFHNERIGLLQKLVQSKFKIKLMGAIPNRQTFTARQVRRLLKITQFSLDNIGLGTIVDRNPFLNVRRNLPNGGNLPVNLLKSAVPPVFGRKMYEEMAQTRICLNTHIDVAGNYAGNLRIFEATGMGACLVTDEKKNMCELFKDDEVVLYSNIEDCLDKTNWLLNNPTKAAQIAERGRQRAYSSHTTFHRASELIDFINRIGRL